MLLPVERTAEAVDFFLMGAVDQPLVVGLPVVVFVCFLLVLALLVALGTVAFLLACCCKRFVLFKPPTAGMLFSKKRIKKKRNKELVSSRLEQMAKDN